MIYSMYSNGYIKIGFTKDSTTLKARRATMQTASPKEVVILGHVGGGCYLEREFHRMLSCSSECGEWFNLDNNRASALSYMIKTFSDARKIKKLFWNVRAYLPYMSAKGIREFVDLAHKTDGINIKEKQTNSNTKQKKVVWLKS